MESLAVVENQEDSDEAALAASERRAKIFRAALESELIGRYAEASPETKILFCSISDTERGVHLLIPDFADRWLLDQRCLRIQRWDANVVPIRLLNDNGELSPFALRIIGELRPRLQNNRARRISGQLKFSALRGLLVSVILDGLKRGILSLACVYAFCRTTRLRSGIWATGLLSRRGVARDAECIALLERTFQAKGLAFLAPDGNLSDAGVEVLDEVRIHLMCLSDPHLEPMTDFDREEEYEEAEAAAKLAA